MIKTAAPTLDGFIGEEMEVEGTVRFAHLLRVDGKLKGRVESYETLVVGEKGRVEAEVIVGALKIHGVVAGRVSVDRRVEIFSGGRLEGELYAAAPAVHISEGGVLEGELHMTPASAEGGPAEAGPDEPQTPPPGGSRR